MPPPILGHELAPAPEYAPVHFLFPVGHQPNVLLTVLADGHFFWRRLNLPRETLQATPGSTPEYATRRWGRGPLIFVEVDPDGSYFTRPALPAGALPTSGPRPTVEQIVSAACAVVGRPSPYHLPTREEDLIESRMPKHVALDIIPDCISSPCILTLNRWDWGMMFYIRVDLAGYYHAYPHVGGPFKTLEEVYTAVEDDLKLRLDPKITTRQPEDSEVDYVVRRCLYWPDGKRKRRFDVDERRERKRLLVQALVDKYNDYVGDLAYELKDVVHYNSVCVRDSYQVTYHINFTAKLMGTEEDELFFAEVTCDTKTGKRNFVVSCFCRIEPTDNGKCYGCNAKHPNADVYSPGQADACFPFGASNTVREDTDEDPVAEEARLRLCYEKMGLNEPGYKEKQRAIMNGIF